MKKISVTVLAAIMFVTVLCFTGTAQKNETLSEETVNNIALLSALDIADIDIDSIVIDEGISQKFFVSMILASMFESADTDDDDWVRDTAVGLKITDKSEYKPNMLLTKTDAANMALKALGYGVFEGYEAALGRKSETKLLSVITTKGKYITAGEAINMICKMLEEKVLCIYEVANGYVGMKTYKVETILSHYRNISTLEDIVTDNGISNLYGESVIGAGKAYVGENLINCKPGQMKEFLGKNVVVYTRPQDGFDAKLLYVCEKKNNIVKIDDENILSSDLKGIKYSDEQGKEKKASFDTFVKVIYNGEAYASWTVDDFKLNNGFIELIDNDDSGKYDIVKITEYKTTVAKYVSSAEKIIVGEFENSKLLTSVKIDPDDYGKHRIIKNGAQIGISGIYPGDILSVAESKSGRVKEIYVSDKKLDGYVERIDTDDKKITIDGQEYCYSGEFENNSVYNEPFAKFPSIGEDYTFRFDFNGKIASVSSVTGTAVIYAYLTNIFEYGRSDKEVQFKMFDQYGDWVKYYLRSKVRFNGKAGVKPEKVYDEIADGFEPQLIKYRLDENNLIKEVDFSENTQELGYDGFSRRNPEEYTYIQQSNSFSNTVFVDDGAVMWFVPEDKKNENLYFIGGVGNLNADAKYTVAVYDLDSSGSSSYFTVNLGAANLKDQSLMFSVVTGKGTMLDTKGNIVNYIKCYIEKYSDEKLVLGDNISPDDVKKGDIVRLYLNPAGTVENIEKLWSADDGETEKIPDTSSLRNVRAQAVTGKIKAVYSDKNLIVLVNGTTVQPLRLRQAGRLLVYYKKDNIVKDVGLSELLPGDYAVLFSRYSSIYNAVIVRD